MMRGSEPTEGTGPLEFFRRGGPAYVATASVLVRVCPGAPTVTR
jgi:hypothetical protein